MPIPETTVPSMGIRSPGKTAIRSPGCISERRRNLRLPSVPTTVAPCGIMRARPVTAFRAFRLIAWSSVRPASRKKMQRCHSVEIGVRPAGKGVVEAQAQGEQDSDGDRKVHVGRCASKPNSMPKRKKSALNRPQRAWQAGPRSGGMRVGFPGRRRTRPTPTGA